jgi:hypothetical protein
MPNETVVQQLPGSVPNERVLVCLRQSDGRWSIALRQQHWAEGIGWYDQKVIQLDPRQWSALRGMFSGPQVKVVGLTEAPQRTIPFPGPKCRETPARKAADQA